MTTFRYVRSSEELLVARRAAELYGVNYLLGYDSDPKTTKSNAISNEFATVIQYLAPHRIGGGETVCQDATTDCIKLCLHTAGNPAHFKGKNLARVNRKRLFQRDRALYLELLEQELHEQVVRAQHIGRRLAVRLNGTSDIPWETEHPELFERFRDIVFYDYTKSSSRMLSSLPENYHLTFSRSERNESTCLELLNRGCRVACVFSTARTKTLPASYLGFPVTDQDTDDLTFLRQGGQWLGLRAKGLARRGSSGFVVQV
jgi:hypothetical protein